MAFGTRSGFEPLRSAAFGAITGSYTAVGPATSGHVRIFNINNATDHDILVSLDGVTDHLRLFTGSFQLFDFSTNKIQNDGFFIPVGTVFYVKSAGVAPTSGNVWIEVVVATAGGV